MQLTCLALLLSCSDVSEEAEAELSCAIDLPPEECRATGCTSIVTGWIIDHTDRELPQACEQDFTSKPAKSCLPLRGEEAGSLIAFYQRDLPDGNKEILVLPNLYPPDTLEGWNGCWTNEGPIPEGQGYVECRCDLY